MNESTYTLADYYRQAGVKDEISFAKYIPIDLRDGNGNLCKPRPDQVVGLNLALRSNRFGLYDSPGVGKTVISQAHGLFFVGQGEKCIVIMPPILLYQFQESFKETYVGVEKFVNIHILDQDPRKRKALYDGWDEGNSWPEFLCMSYQMFLREFKLLYDGGHYSVIIADECHFLKNIASKTTKAVEKFLDKAEDSIFLGMTGTPIENHLGDAYALIHLTNPNAYASQRQFDRKHCVYTRIRLKEPIISKGGKKIMFINKLVGYKNKAELKANLYKNARRVTKDQVMTLSGCTVIPFSIRLDPKHQTLYKKLAKEKVLELSGDEILAALNAQKLRQSMLQIISDPLSYMPDDSKINNRVFEAIREKLDGVDITSTKVILFANYKGTVRALKKEFADLNPAILNGEVSNKEVQKQKFLKDDTCRILIANPKSAGVGLNLQSVCHNAIFVEPCPVPGMFNQACERIFRGGQLNMVNIWILKVLGTVSPDQIENMLRKEDQIQSINHDSESLLKELLGDK